MENNHHWEKKNKWNTSLKCTNILPKKFPGYNSARGNSDRPRLSLIWGHSWKFREVKPTTIYRSEHSRGQSSMKRTTTEKACIKIYRWVLRSSPEWWPVHACEETIWGQVKNQAGHASCSYQPEWKTLWYILGVLRRVLPFNNVTKLSLG